MAGNYVQGYRDGLRGTPVPDEASVYYRLGHKDAQARLLQVDALAEARASRKHPVNYIAPEGYANDPAYD